MDIPDIHPNVAGIYRRKVERLAEALRRPQERDEAAEAIRALIDRITLTPGPKRGEIAPRCMATSARSSNGRLKSEHSRPGWLGSVGFSGCGARIRRSRHSLTVAI